jgi:hypothetical protein
LQDPPEFTEVGIFGLKINHLATLFSVTWQTLGRFFEIVYTEGLPFERQVQRLILRSISSCELSCRELDRVIFKLQVPNLSTSNLI